MRGSVIGDLVLEGDGPQGQRSLSAYISLNSVRCFAGLLDREANVLNIGGRALKAIGFTLSNVEGKPFWSAPWWQVSNERREALKNAVDRAAEGEAVQWRGTVHSGSAEGTTRDVEVLLTPVTNDGGEVTFIAVEAQDITETSDLERENRRLAEELRALKAGIDGSAAVVPEGTLQDVITALRKSEERFRAFVTASSDVVYSMSADWLEMRHLEGKDFIETTVEPDQTWLTKYIHPDDQPLVMATIEKAIKTKSIFELEHRVLQVDGTLGWTFSRAIPLFDEKGEITDWFGAASDITSRKRHEQHQRMLLDELNHRVKNTLATVQSMAKQTLRNAGNVRESREALDARLIALSKAHNVLTRQHWEGAELHEVVKEALGAHASDGRGQDIGFEGPKLRLRPRAALALSMALHELATNAVKYGALSVQGGLVEISWRIDEDRGRFHLLWTETGGPPVAIPLQRGFGSRLIEGGLSQDLNGDVKLDFLPIGVTCTIEAPLDELSVKSEDLREPMAYGFNLLGA